MKNLYALLLGLFPKAYREEYGDELQAVFSLSLDDARKTGWMELAGVILRELMGLPKAILHEHLRERRKMKMMKTFGSRFDFAPGSRNETLAALAPFLLFGALPTLFSFISNSVIVPVWIQIAFALFFWFSVLSLFMIGFAKSGPRWFMPYLGLPLPILSLILFNALMDPEWRGFPRLMQAPWVINQFVYQGLLWSILIPLTILLVALSALIPRLRPFYHRLRDDWTLLSFVLYGMAPFALVVSFDDYQNEEPYLILSFLILAFGGWLYLRSKDPANRFLVLFGGMALSMLVAAVGKAILYAGPWPRLKYFTWQSEFISTIIEWAWLALIMLLPLVINLLPRFDNLSRSAEG